MNRPHEGPRRALGKGLTALLPTNVAPALPATEATSRIPIDEIDPNPVQPRHDFDAIRLEELANSIRANGVIQPLVVRQSGSRYQLVAGERRWRAAKLAGLEHIPVVIQNITDDRLLEITLVENIQREDLNAIETALAFERMARDLHLSHEQIGERTGKDRTTITNLLRLLQLPESIQNLIAEKRISQGHARSLLGLPPELQREVAGKIVAEGLSVRQVEALTQRMTQPRQPKSAKEASQDPNVKAAIETLEQTLGTRVRIIEKSDHSGKIEIDYYSGEELDRIYSRITSNNPT